MVNQQLIEYIKSVREKGFSDENIKKYLIKHGYSQAMVDDAFAKLSPSAYKEKKPFPKKIVFIIIGIIVFAGIGYGAYKLLKVQPLYFSSAVCKNLSIKIYELRDEPVICAFPDNTKLQMILENNGAITINSATVLIKGQNNNMEDIIDNLNLVPGDVFTRVINIDPNTIGRINEIVITPAVVNKKKRFCNDKKLVFKDIKTC